MFHLDSNHLEKARCNKCMRKLDKLCSCSCGKKKRSLAMLHENPSANSVVICHIFVRLMSLAFSTKFSSLTYKRQNWKQRQTEPVYFKFLMFS